MESSEILVKARTKAETPPGWIVLPLSRNSVLTSIAGWLLGIVLGFGLFAIMASVVIPHNYQFGIIPALITTISVSYTHLTLPTKRIV